MGLSPFVPWMSLQLANKGYWASPIPSSPAVQCTLTSAAFVPLKLPESAAVCFVCPEATEGSCRFGYGVSEVVILQIEAAWRAVQASAGLPAQASSAGSGQREYYVIDCAFAVPRCCFHRLPVAGIGRRFQ